MSKFGQPIDRADILHTNALGKMAQGKPVSFEARRLQDSQRSVIGAYTSAGVHNVRTFGSTPARPFSTGTRPDVSPTRAIPSRPTPPAPPQKYNPYA